MLELKDLRVAYGHTQAVDGIGLTVGPGEAVALLGANGAGKTSTLRAISRLLPSDGELTFDGADVSRLAPEELARRGLVHVPEGRRVFASLTVHDNLLVGRTAQARRDALFSPDDVYDLFPALVPLRKRHGWALSGGEQQMVAIGRGLLASPRLLMLDEPSLGLAPIVVKAVYQALAEIKQRVSILLVEQNATLALTLCDRGYVLLSGRVVLSGAAAELGDREALLDSYLGHGGGAAGDSDDGTTEGDHRTVADPDAADATTR
ncbi:ABC transporter ATP-binding protein [Sphaerisporangium rubeum]|uniref:Branched-chain amino acid transport system ATP-binding protein n=1 Tax=Sphaerisporangium rubeum TaxID=321317 RepID=A0A7X0M7T0_9ACTN|nr:ABC transporter ATP-binding protein [Sphaerisporangium rubeum]MBB6473359.1 branched-chain amino acid transport system ATP-binding protein [Sphaerisporangium rubeum]